MENKQKILKKICQKATAGLAPNEMKGLTFYGTMRFYNHLTKEYGETAADQWLLGWLKSKDTMVAVFGEEKTCCDGKTENCRCFWEGCNFVLAWQYHHNQTAGFAAIETLEYMEKYV